MVTKIPELWPDDISTQVAPPIAILKVQESALARRTAGMLEAMLTTTTSGNLVRHDLDLMAPALNLYRERLLSAWHARDKYYPVKLTAECFLQKPAFRFLGAKVETTEDVDALPPAPRTAATAEELLQLIREVLQSTEVRATIHSLVARINELQAQPA